MIEFHLDSRSGVSPYLQVVQQVRQALRLGLLREGDQLPTVKEVVARLAINPNTVLKAYRELEHAGLVAARPGIGTFVTKTLSDASLQSHGPLRRDLQRWLIKARWWTDSAPQGEFWALVLAALLFNFGVSVFFFLYNLFMLDLRYREQSLGMSARALGTGSMTGTIPMGMVARRVGVKKVLIVCLVLMSVAFGARVFLFWYPAQIAFAFFDGVMLCGWVVCLSPAVANVVEERKRPFAFSVLFAVAVATGSLGGLVGGNMPAWCQTFGQSD